MTVKLTIKKKESEERTFSDMRKRRNEVNSLKGNDKLEYDIKMLNARIKNVEYDIKNLGHTPILKNKINEMKKQLEILENEKNSITKL